jgi:hypothetical protein
MPFCSVPNADTVGVAKRELPDPMPDAKPAAAVAQPEPKAYDTAPTEGVPAATATSAPYTASTPVQGRAKKGGFLCCGGSSQSKNFS